MNKPSLTWLFVLLVLASLLVAGRAACPILITNVANVRLMSLTREDDLLEEDQASAYLKGVVYLKHGLYFQAVEALSSTQSPNPLLVNWYLAQAQEKVGNWQIALSLLDENVPAHMKLYISVLVKHLNELPSEQQGIWLEKVKQHPDMMVQFAAQLLAEAQYEQVAEWIVQIPDYGKSTDALLILGQSYFYRSGGVERAEATFRLAYQLLPDAITAYWYGRSMAYTGKPDQALPLLREAVAKASSRSDAAWYLLALGGTQAQLEHCREARDAYDQALEMDPSPENVQRVSAARASLSQVCVLP